ILVRIGSFLDEKLSPRIYDAVARMPLKIQTKSDGMQPVRDLDQMRNFLSSLGPAALFDLPWMPLYLGICFPFHVWIGITPGWGAGGVWSGGGGGLIRGVGFASRVGLGSGGVGGAWVVVSRRLGPGVPPRARAGPAPGGGARRRGLAEVPRRNAEVLQAMGM